MNKLETALEALNVEINRYVIGEGDKQEVIVVGGLEVVDRYLVKDFKEVNDSWEKIDVKSVGGDNKVLLPFMYTNVLISSSHLTQLSKFRDMKSLTKEEASKYDVVDKDRVLNKIVYVYEKEPSTNSLALAKQFQLKHKHVIEQIFKLAEQNPSILMGIKYGIYEDSIPMKGSSMKNKSKPSTGKPRDDKWVVETSTTQMDDRQTVYNTFLHISEDAYYNFVLSMGTPKSKEMKVYRQLKQKECFTAFQALRDVLLSTGISEEELERIISIRTEQTKNLMDAIYDYVEHYNSNSGEQKQLNHIKTSRLIFNLINHHLDIDAKVYNSNKGNKSKGDVVLQGALKTFFDKRW